MSKSKPLTDLELIDCAKANAKQGVENAAKLSGYGDDIDKFMEELQTACQRIGVNIDTLSDLIKEQQQIGRIPGLEIAPDSESSL
ncbi:MAG: hypothetical protein RSE13_17860 [Planktothrix sp. GU0601_MAG3]|nr:MAG: hypothetical protein RSE13_17860 [Planktothrix sp. GU0601_MAG3]